MKKVIRKILKEENENMVEKVKNSFNTLMFIIETNVNKNIIEDIKLDNIFYGEKYGNIEGLIKVKSYSEDPDVGSFTNIINKVDDELYNVIKNYEFNKEGVLKKNQEDTYLMFLFKSCKWDWDTNEIFMEYFLMQEEFR